MMTHLPPSLSVKVHFSTVSGAPLVIVVWDESHPIQLIALSVPRSWYGPRWYKIAYGGLWWCQTRPAIRFSTSPTGSQIGSQICSLDRRRTLCSGLHCIHHAHFLEFKVCFDSYFLLSKCSMWANIFSMSLCLCVLCMPRKATLRCYASICDDVIISMKLLLS